MAFLIFMFIIWLFILGIKCIPDIKRKFYLDNERKRLENIRLSQSIQNYNNNLKYHNDHNNINKTTNTVKHNDSYDQFFDIKDNEINDDDIEIF